MENQFEEFFKQGELTNQVLLSKKADDDAEILKRKQELLLGLDLSMRHAIEPAINSIVMDFNGRKDYIASTGWQKRYDDTRELEVINIATNQRVKFEITQVRDAGVSFRMADMDPEIIEAPVKPQDIVDRVKEVLMQMQQEGNL